jgi:hypothetical protein
LKSKWGDGPLATHEIDDQPYTVDYQNTNFYRKCYREVNGFITSDDILYHCKVTVNSLSYDTKYTSVYGYCGGYYMAFPNPVSNYVDIDINPEAIEMSAMSYDSEQDKLIQVYDEMGIIYFSSEFKRLPYRLKTNKLPEGNYMVQIIDGQNVSSIQIIIDHK